MEKERRTYYSDLGVSAKASRKEIEAAHWRWQRLLPADESARAARRRAEKAYLVLADDRARTEYDRKIGEACHPAWREGDARSARESFQRCLALIGRGDGARALRVARRCHALDPSSATYRSYYALLLAREGGCLREAMSLGRTAHGQEPGDRAIALNLAEICERAGLSRRSQQLRRRWRRGLFSLLRLRRG